MLSRTGSFQQVTTIYSFWSKSLIRLYTHTSYISLTLYFLFHPHSTLHVIWGCFLVYDNDEEKWDIVIYIAPPYQALKRKTMKGEWEEWIWRTFDMMVWRRNWDKHIIYYSFKNVFKIELYSALCVLYLIVVSPFSFIQSIR